MLLRMHKRRTDFDSLKFTLPKIHNKIDIPISEVTEFFRTHSLKECAIKYNCSSITIKRKLRAAGVDTSIHNHSGLASKNRASKEKPSDELIRKLYIDDNLDTKTIAESYGLHYNTIRNIIRRLGLQKTAKLIAKSMMERHQLQHGVRHPSQRPDVIKKTSINKVEYKGQCFKSLIELGYALYLDKNGIEWYYEEMRIPYIDMMNGKRRIYVIDFTIINGDEVSWIEIKPNNEMIPDDKRIYAERRAEESGITYRGLNDDECEQLWQTIREGYNFKEVKFLYRAPRSTTNTKITYYFKTEQEATAFTLDGWKQFTKPINDGVLWKKILVRK